jgi:V-type H+-transporting ATPase subunit D
VIPLHGRPDRVLNGALTAISLSAKDLHTRIVIMSGTGPRESIFPTRMALTNTKTRLKGAQTGHSLLAKKRDALTTRFRAILRKVDEVSHHSPPPRIQEIASSRTDEMDFYEILCTHKKIKAKRKMGRVMQLASFSLAEVTYATGDIAYLVQEQAKSASFKVRAKQENVSGVVLPAFEVDRAPGTGAHQTVPFYFF